ncbi:hypothetical protein Scep_016725 [Stephania cephalantha]|uniref:RNA helicase n=1 Tax=Stephania cephalantha TaxID=152367 RepID=A0AAP0INC6_9MAGN
MPCSANLLRGTHAYASLRLRLPPPLRSLRLPKTLPPSLSDSHGTLLTFRWLPQPRSLVTAKALSGTRSVELERRRSQGGTGLSLGGRNGPFPYFLQQNSPYGRFAFDDFSEDESDREAVAPSQQKGTSTLDNVDEWKWKLTMLMRNKDEQELLSREKKDRRDFEQLAALATRMGLHSRQYSRVVVFSKVPLPNYRPDLDDKRPQREVIIGSALQRRVDALLKEYLYRRPLRSGRFLDSSSTKSNINDGNASDGRLFEVADPPQPTNVVMEKIYRRKSLQLRDKQQSWQVVVVSGETGCGKTTQLPQFILESEIDAARGAVCSIICTQPRRISAMAVSERVAAERGESLGESVGYKVRLEGVKGRDTRLLFCTTGILLRRLLVDRNLKGVTHVVVDEIHERGMNEDFLLIVLKELLPRRPELRLILMSATLNAELFSSYFGAAPMLHIPGFTYPVRTHFLENVLEMTGHWLSPHNQIDDYGQDKSWKMQKQILQKRKSQIASVAEDTLQTACFRDYSPRTQDSLACWNPDSIGFNLIESVLCHICKRERPGAVLVFMTGWDDINALKDQLQAHPILGDPSRVLLLACHGSMASAEQRLIFEKPEDGVRKIVLATNMAETSITINDVVFVVDCGKAKETSYDALNNTPCLLPSWISKAAARQRRGRAGRVQPGECYHLYPKCVYDAFADYQIPELLRTPLQSLCLQIKSLELGSISEFLSKALQAPEPLSVKNAIEYLKVIGALDQKENLTILGRHLSMLPMEPKLGKMLILATIFKCLDPILTVVAGLCLRDPFVSPLDKKDVDHPHKPCASNSFQVVYLQVYNPIYLSPSVDQDFSNFLRLAISSLSSHVITISSTYTITIDFFPSLDCFTNKLAESAKSQFAANDHSDHLVLIRAFEGWKDAEQEKNGYEYCWRNFLSPQTLKAIGSLRKQYLTLLKDTGLVDDEATSCNLWSHDDHLIRAIICAGLYPGICSVVTKQKHISLKTMEDGQVLLHSNSVNSRELRIPYPWLVFNEKVKVNSVFLRDSTGVSDSMLLLLGGSVHRGGLDGHLKMMGGYFEFFMKPLLAETYLELKQQLDELIQNKLQNPKLDLDTYDSLLSAVRQLISEDQCDGRFVFGQQVSGMASKDPLSRGKTSKGSNNSVDGNSKGHLQTLLIRAGHCAPKYATRQLMNNKFRTRVEFNGLEFVGQPCSTKKLAEKDAAAQALQWLTGGTEPGAEDSYNMSLLLKPEKKKRCRRS